MPTWDVGFQDIRDNVLTRVRADKTMPENVRQLLDNVLSTFPSNKPVVMMASSRVDNDSGYFLIKVRTV